MSLKTSALVEAQVAASSVQATAARRRSLVLLAVGALIGLALAGYSLFSAGVGAKTVPTDAVALVNGRAILRRDFDLQAENEYGKPQAQLTAPERQAVLDAMIREELLVQRGLEIDVPKTDPDVRQAIVNAVNLTSATEIAATPTTDAELRAYYDSHREDYVIFGTLRLREVIVPPGPDAEAIARRVDEAWRRLDHGSDPSAVLAKFGLRLSGRFPDEEIVEPVAERTLGPELFAVAARLRPGEISAPVRQPDGFHLLRLQQREAKRYFPFEAVREKVQRNLRSAAQAKAEQELVATLRAKAEIILAP